MSKYDKLLLQILRGSSDANIRLTIYAGYFAVWDLRNAHVAAIIYSESRV